MSKIGKEPVEIPKGVECRIEGNTISVKGPKGTLSLVLLRGVKALLEGNKMMFLVDEKKQGGSTKFQGLYRTLVSNMVKGVTDGFIKKLELKGVGYRAAVQGAKLNLQLGFSHPTLKEIPSGVEVKVENNTLITISGSDKQLIGQFASEIHHMRKPEPYKGKGVHYLGQYVRRKAGKAAAKK